MLIALPCRKIVINLLNQAIACHHGEFSPEITVKPNIPILYFGDLDAYIESKLKIVTVGINPSYVEFPTGNPFQRFPAFGRISSLTPLIPTSPLIQGYNEYFYSINAPYTRWFNNLEAVLSGFDTSFYNSSASTSYISQVLASSHLPKPNSNKCHTAIHTDFRSPVATNPVWSGLKSANRSALSAGGVDLWHKLMDYLQPQIILTTIGEKSHFNDMFNPIHPIYSKYGKRHLGSFPILSRGYHIDWYEVTINGSRCDVIYSKPIYRRPMNLPFGYFNAIEKQSIGPLLKGKIHNW